MAQALFDEHPLEQYLRNAGEARDMIPGSTADIELELDPLWGVDLEEDEHEEGSEWRPLFLINIMEVFSAIISAVYLPSHPSPFIERFKYDVISSSLLAVTLPSAHIRTPRLSLPGQLDHSRTSSVEPEQQTSTSLSIASPDSSYLIPSLALIMVAIFFHAEKMLLALASLGISVYTFQTLNDVPKRDMSPSLESLNDLIASSNEWEFVVQEAISILENDERSTSYGNATPTSPSSSIRVALHSSLLTTQTQCDNVRQLFSALTSPSELSQLSEMYAPPSPMTSSFLQEGNPRPLSLPARRRTLSMPVDPFLTMDNKRQTWNGSYTKLVQLGSPTNQVFKRREKRRSDLSALLQVSNHPSLKSMSAPVTPIPPALPHVSEEAESDYEDAQETMQGLPTSDESPSFGAAALALQRKRKNDGMEAFQLLTPSFFSPSPVYSPSLTPQTPRTPPTATLTSGSRFTPIQTSRHPLSLSAINFALQGALASKRYACSHLLALRFADEDDEGYWEDVRSVMGLLTSTLVDASSRLSDALIQVEQQKLRDQNPTPGLISTFPGSDDSDKSTESEPSSPSPSQAKPLRPTSISFAPLPSHMSRFAAHVEAIMSALDDARDNLEQCIAALREETGTNNSAAGDDSKRRRRRQSRAVSESSVEEPAAGAAARSPALEAYERLRRELGLALRECERGRERLLDVVDPPELRSGEEEEDSGDDVPALGHDGSEESDKPDRSFPFDDEGEQEQGGVEYAVVAVEGAEGNLDDATSHLLLATSTQHLPPPGIEQVFEADSGNVGMFKRERSKLTREERIKLVKARRESGGSVLGLVDFSSSTTEVERGAAVEKWGPGGEVVQELKDVIWKVGERRRRMADATATLDSVTPSEARSDL
ncbi:hypothetical protein D9615_006496 [Tricholomella constricta]|uniref:Myosin-binding domain-containing protein n=1 Tax=Tricholomella constricta TaxID=117010 RepID=A0A8H5M3E2_9AGAR|nr:hypothetical protein D9615_006496 [Tricholomella constricta]